tara:strand:- start:1304 stop:1504 length:201 start_codon:yes stop_codon:yes gene_type:complete
MSLYTMIENDAGGLGASDIGFIRIIWKDYLTIDAKTRKHRKDRHKVIRDILEDKRKAENLYADWGF